MTSHVEGIKQVLKDIAPGISIDLQLLLMGIMQEIERMDTELAVLADVVVGDRRYSIGGLTDDHAQQPGPDGGIPGSARPATVADHHARL